MYDDADPSPYNDVDQGFYRLQHQYPRLVGCTETNFLHAVEEMKVLSVPGLSRHALLGMSCPSLQWQLVSSMNPTGGALVV